MTRVAAYQAIPESTFNGRSDQILVALEEADQNQIDVVCFPEGFLTGYYAQKEDAIQNSLDRSPISKKLALRNLFLSSDSDHRIQRERR